MLSGSAVKLCPEQSTVVPWQRQLLGHSASGMHSLESWSPLKPGKYKHKINKNKINLFTECAHPFTECAHPF